MPGVLTLCGVPIGNLADITLRVLDVLRTADYIAAEDTRHSLRLLNAYDIRVPLISYHEHSDKHKADHLIGLLLSGKNIALVTDAGMPCISDPGEDLVRLCRANGIAVTVAPGPSAFVAALAVSGVSAARFAFEGFLPSHLRAKKERRARLAAIAAEPRTVILYESPHHLLVTLADLAAHVPGRTVVAARELTKLHEEVLRGSAETMLAHFENVPPRGEFVLVIEAAEAPPKEEAVTDADVVARVAALVDAGDDPMTAIKKTARAVGIGKRAVYAAWNAKPPNTIPPTP